MSSCSVLVKSFLGGEERECGQGIAGSISHDALGDTISLCAEHLQAISIILSHRRYKLSLPVRFWEEDLREWRR